MVLHAVVLHVSHMGMGPMLMLSVGAAARVRCHVECGQAISESELLVLCTPPERAESEGAQKVAIAPALCGIWAVLCMCDH
jgi:hypothetical protein